MSQESVPVAVIAFSAGVVFMFLVTLLSGKLG